MSVGAAPVWSPVIERGQGPLYLAIADRIAADIGSGRLAAGARLPPQRVLAGLLGIDFTTVSRAYAEAAQRGLVRSRVGQGTFVRVPPAASTAGGVDLSMNLPPRFENAALERRLAQSASLLEEAGGLDLLLRYQEPGGAMADREAGAQWLATRLPGLVAERVVVCPGAQGALAATVGLLAAPGDTILTEALTYPGFRSLAVQLRLRLVGVAMDVEGIEPAAFEAACQREAPKALYCTPVLQNPTTATMSLARRQQIVAIARRHAVPIIEDDAYGLLPRSAPPTLAALAPELVYYIGGLAKVLSPALRIAYLAAPDARLAQRVAGGIRAMAAMASPLTAALATRWIINGTAAAVLGAIRVETAARRELATRFLPDLARLSQPDSFHLWLPLPPPWTRGDLAGRLRAMGVGVVVSDAFAVLPPPEAVRIGLGAARTRQELSVGLQAIADLLAQAPALSSTIV
jgi:DNA-binding transcriptional MocR family regulator